MHQRLINLNKLLPVKIQPFTCKIINYTYKAGQINVMLLFILLFLYYLLITISIFFFRKLSKYLRKFFEVNTYFSFKLHQYIPPPPSLTVSFKEKFVSYYISDISIWVLGRYLSTSLFYQED